MTIKKVLLIIDDTPPGRAALHVAVRLCSHSRAHLLAVHVKPDLADAITLIGEGLSDGLVDEIMTVTDRESGRRREAARALFDTFIKEAGFPETSTPAGNAATAEWQDATGRETEAVVRFGRLADVIVLGRPAEALASPAGEILHAALYETGRPVMIAPRVGPPAIGRRIAVAWSGSIEGCRAIAGALPLLEQAESVRVVASKGETGETGDGADCLNYLAWHGVTAELRAIADDGDIGEQLLRSAEGCDLLVMGAFTHSRLRAWILGGVTRHLLEHDGPTLFMAH